MTIFDYMLSETARTYCTKNGREPGLAELALIVHRDKELSLSEKHQLYRSMIALLPDCSFDSHGIYDEGNVDSIHAFLSKYMLIEERLIYKFFSEEQSAVYTYKLWYEAEREWAGEDGALYADLAEARADFADDAELSPDFALCCKRYIGREDKRIYVRMRQNGDILRVEEDRILTDDEVYKILYDVFYGMDLVFGNSAYSE